MTENKERRGRPKLEVVETPRKFTRVYEHEDSTVIWKFDLDKFDKGPIDVEIRHKNGSDTLKYWSKKRKEAKDERRINREMRKINEKNNLKKTTTRKKKTK
jgi:hypothetical protein